MHGGRRAVGDKVPAHHFDTGTAIALHRLHGKQGAELPTHYLGTLDEIEYLRKGIMAASDRFGSDQDRPRRNRGSRDRDEREGSSRDDGRSQFSRRETVWRGRDEGAVRRPDDRSERPDRPERFSQSDRGESSHERRGAPSRDFSDRPRDFGDRHRSFGDRRESRGWQDRDRDRGDFGRDRSGGSHRDGEMPRRERPSSFSEDRPAPRRDFGGGPRGGREGGFRGRDEAPRDERRPSRYPSTAGSRFGVGRGPRVPRQPLKKKKKVRVFFHQALTRILLPKLLTKSKYLSPRLARNFIETGRVRVNARVVSSPYYEVNLRKERVTIDEAPTEYPRRLAYMIYNKPRGVVCQKGDEAFDAIFEPEFTWSFPFGRLSKSISGLVILSNDPRMVKCQHAVDIELQKEYRVKLNRHLTDRQVDELRRGVLVGDEYLVPLRVNLVRRNANSMWLDIILLDDSYHRIYGAFKTLGAEVVSLRRSRIALINETMVPNGEWRELSGFEITALGLARFMPGELPPEPPPPPKPKLERKFPQKRDARDNGRKGPGAKGAWDRRPGGPGGGKRPYGPRPASREEEYEERLRQEAEADAIGNK